MVFNFWIDRRRERQLSKLSDQIALENDITPKEFYASSRIKQIEMLEDYLKHHTKKAK